MKIRAALFGPDSAEPSIETLELEEPRPDEILVRVAAVGVCHTDLHCADPASFVPKPIVLGHEGAGIVERVGSSVGKVRPGDHVVMAANSCGQCEICAAGAPAYCLELQVLNFGGQRRDGSSPLSRNGSSVHGNFFGQSSFAEFAICNERNAVVLPRDMPLEIVAPLGCGVQTGAGSVLNAFDLRPGQSLAVFGTGGVGLGAVMAARVAGASRIIAVDLQRHRLDTALELGATDAIDASEEDALDAIMRLTGRGVDFALDTTGAVAVIEQAVESLATLGTCGVLAGGRDVTVSVGHLMRGGRSIRGIIQGDSVPDVLIPKLAGFYRQGRFPLERLIRFYDFDRIADAMRDAESGVTIKPVLRLPA